MKVESQRRGFARHSAALIGIWGLAEKLGQPVIEFDLETMMEEEHYADFAIMYRLLHSSRMSAKTDMGAESLIEKYHQDAMDSGSRIREGLSNAVEYSIRSLANGFLKHADNEDLREKN